MDQDLQEPNTPDFLRVKPDAREEKMQDDKQQHQA